MVITISQLHPLDWETYKGIRLESLMEDPKAFGSSFEKENNFTDQDWQERIGNPDNCILVAKDNVTPVGVIGYHLKDQGENAHLWGMFVSKNYRGQGLGKQLMQQIIEKVKELKNVVKVTLDVNPTQIVAVNLYESLGFQHVGKRPYVMGDGIERELSVFELILSK